MGIQMKKGQKNFPDGLCNDDKYNCCAPIVA